jgi:predicted MFS family arabinose efflux permease
MGGAVPAGAARPPAAGVPGCAGAGPGAGWDWRWWPWAAPRIWPGWRWLLFLFFCGSNILEASQPSIASRLAPAGARGAALGFYNTLMSFGFFAGGALGGLLVKVWGPVGLFGLRRGHGGGAAGRLAMQAFPR